MYGNKPVLILCIIICLSHYNEGSVFVSVTNANMTLDSHDLNNFYLHFFQISQ